MVKTIDNAVFDDSASFTISQGPSVPSSIIVTSPHSGESWAKGTSSLYFIRWTKRGHINENVKIRLYQGSTRVLGIVDSTPNDGEYGWEIPDSISEGEYTIRVKTVDNTVYGESSSFTISQAQQLGGIMPSITIMNPHLGDIWHNNNSFNITWRKTGRMSDNVKIELYREERKVFDIANSTPNDGEYNWHIPKSINKGEYKIRVKTVDNTVYDDSGNFNIEEQSHSEGFSGRRYHALRDFELKDIFYIYNRGGWIVARIKNHTNPFNGSLKFKVSLKDREEEKTFIIDKHLNLESDEERNIYLITKEQFKSCGSYCAKLVSVKIDPRFEITETNERNNHLVKTIMFDIADLQVSVPSSEVHVRKVHSVTHKWNVRFNIHFKFRGGDFKPFLNVKAKWQLRKSDGTLLFTQNLRSFKIYHGDEKILNIERNFGHPLKIASVKPRLKKGHYTITVTSTTDAGVCESPLNNNNYSFSIHLH